MILLRPLHLLFGAAVSVRNALYDKGWKETKKLPVFVVSVGNLSVGGTGKTSFVIWLLQELERRGVKAGVVSRGYGGRVQSSAARVPVDGDPGIYGDEPCLIVQETGVPVYIGPKRTEVGIELLKEHTVTVLIADDAFQHRRLHRDVDVVLVDFSEPKNSWHLLPEGRLRENFSSLSRADVIVGTKKELGNEKNFPALESRLPRTKIRLNMEYRLKDLHASPEEKFLLVSGVGRPQGVEKLARKQVAVVDHKVFTDHFDYARADVENLLQEMRKLGADFILTTEKDAVKLKKFSELKPYLKVMKLEYFVEGQVDEFFEKLFGENR